MDNKLRIKKIIAILKNLYPQAKCSLYYKTPVQLLVATILSAQCTDERVNIVTKELFKKYKTAGDFAKLKQEVLETAIRSTGFYHNKAKNILKCMQDLAAKYNGKVPRTMEAMIGLAGVGRKTANVVLGNAYGLAFGIAVDTHVLRLSKRLGLTKQSDPVKVEAELMKIVPAAEWIMLTHYFIWHGRKLCKAIKPDCENCKINKHCRFLFPK